MPGSVAKSLLDFRDQLAQIIDGKGRKSLDDAPFQVVQVACQIGFKIVAFVKHRSTARIGAAAYALSVKWLGGLRGFSDRPFNISALKAFERLLFRL